MTAKSESGPEKGKSLFMYLVSQDLGEPFAEFRRRFLEAAEENQIHKLRENLSSLSESLYHLDRLVRDLVDTAAIESGSVTFKEESVDLASLLSAQISKRIHRLKGFRIQPELPSSSLTIKCDPERFATLINDLLDAVILFSPRGGTILVRLGREEGKVIFAAENRTADVPPSRSGSLLEWLRESLHEKAGFEGAGIGLYRSYLTARMWEGQLHIETPPGGGISFTLRIPDRD